METVDEEFLAAALDFIDRQNKDGKPFFCWFNSTRMHIFTHLKPASEGKTGLGIYPDGMVEHDGYVGQLLKKLDDLGIVEDTIVVYTTDNGAEVMSAGPTAAPRRSAARRTPIGKAAFRVPCVDALARRHQAGHGFQRHLRSLQDFLPTFAAAAGDPDIVAKVRQGLQGRQ